MCGDSLCATRQWIFPNIGSFAGLTRLNCIVYGEHFGVDLCIVFLGGGVTKGHMTLVLDGERYEEGS